MADAAAEVGLELPPLPDATQTRLRELVPFAGTRNPLDVTAQFINNPELVEPMLDGLLADGGYASAILFLGASGIIPTVMAGLYPGLERIAQRHRDRVLTICMIAEPATRRRVERMGYLVYEDPARTVRSLGALVKFGACFHAEPTPSPSNVASVAAVKPLALPERCNEHEAKCILAENGVPVVQELIATSRAEAIEAAQRIGFPVVMKVLSSDLPHKSDLGGVVLRIIDADEAGAAYERILDNMRRHAATARIDGVLVSPMVEGGVEMILGVVRDAVFGPVVVVGLGGIYVEVLRDTACRVAPFGVADAHAMLRELKGFAILNGARGQRCDIDALAKAVADLSHFAAAHADEVESIDINPFVVRHDGGFALDALIVPHRPAATR
jgi:acyl-CoA synthetase (NDP forming)